MELETKTAPRWMRGVLTLAGVYNLLWGAVVVLFPAQPFLILNLPPPNYPSLWQCIGMLVGVYGVAYLVAATDPFRHWAVVLAGFLGKVLGPLGFIYAAAKGELPWRFGAVNLTNDLVWWIPFFLILKSARRSLRSSPPLGGTF